MSKFFRRILASRRTRRRGSCRSTTSMIEQWREPNNAVSNDRDAPSRTQTIIWQSVYPRHGLVSRLGWREISTGGTTPMPDSARAESGARADWQACTMPTHAFQLDHRTSCTVFRAIVVLLHCMTIMARSFTTHLTSFVVHRVRFGPDSRESGVHRWISKLTAHHRCTGSLSTRRSFDHHGKGNGNFV